MKPAITAALTFLMTYLTIIFTGGFAPNLYKSLLTVPISHIEQTRKMFIDAQRRYAISYYTPQRNDLKGLVVNNQTKSYAGYTFYIGIDKLQALLRDENGNIVHTWGKNPKEIWTDPNHIAQKSKDYHFSSSRAFLSPETGDAYLTFGSRLRPVFGLGLVKFDKNNQVVWKYDGGVHHDVAFSPDKKRIYVLGKTPVYSKMENLEHMEPPYLDEEIIVLNDKGEELKKISLLKLFTNSQLKIILDKLSTMPADPTFFAGDILHTNTIEVIPDEAVGKAPMLKKGHLMLSFRNLDLLIVMDPETEQVTWASYGPWKGQHDPEIQNDGTVMMFDNQGNLKPDQGASRVLQIDLNDLSIVWEYGGTKESPLFSDYNSSIQILPNDNVLVTESHAGRIFEVTRDKEIVWEFWNPKRLIVKESRDGEQYNNTPHIASVFSGVRYSKEDLSSLNLEFD
ncbi:MAG: hypothetical protein H6861_09280 [Rhodospirillales bacterium]|nr:hypothetical protein [Rhodospirillales bacterium]